jgi:hypothetical protein
MAGFDLSTEDYGVGAKPRRPPICRRFWNARHTSPSSTSTEALVVATPFSCTSWRTALAGAAVVTARCCPVDLRDLCLEPREPHRRARQPRLQFRWQGRPNEIRVCHFAY